MIDSFRNYFSDVGDCMRKFGLPTTADNKAPHMLTKDDQIFRTRFMVEELQEFRDACIEGNLADAVDALVDLVYVALGTAQLMHVPFDECWAEVQRANMQKVRVKSASESKRGSTLDLKKPPGWQPPNLEPILTGKRRG